MIQFNELRITEDGTKIIIDASVQDLSYYEDIYIDHVLIDTHNTFINSGPSNNLVYEYNVEETVNKVYIKSPTCYSQVYTETEEDIVLISDEGNVKRVRLVLDRSDFITKNVNINTDLFYVYVVIKGTPSSDTPCTMDNKTTLGVVYNTHRLYNMTMKYMRELESSCIIPSGLIDITLRLKAFELSILTNNYIQANKFWTKFFNKDYDTYTTPKCNCS